MTDIFSKDKRSEVMSKIRGKNTAAELIAFRYLRKEGLYFQKHYKNAPGSPDIALPRKKKAIFIDGDFWHGKTIDRVMERGADDYWTKKILRNMERDKNQRKQLEEGGWSVLVVWESELKRKSNRDEVLERMRVFLLS